MRVSESGVIDSKGQLRMPMDRLRDVFRLNKGKRVLVYFEFEQRGTSEAQIGYYYNYIVPTIRKALWETGMRLDENSTDRWLCGMCSFIEVETARELKSEDMSNFIDWLKQYAAENLDVFIEDARAI